MKDKKLKISIIFFMMLILGLIMSTAVQARTVKSLYTSNQYISHDWALYNQVTHVITVKGKQYYCGKKGAEYNTNLSTLVGIAANEGLRDFFSSASLANEDKNTRYQYIKSALEALKEPNVVQTMTMEEKNVLTETQKNHIYGILGLGKYYNSTNTTYYYKNLTQNLTPYYVKQQAIWREVGSTTAEITANGNNLYDVGNYYIDKWNKETVDLTGSSDDAKVDVKIDYNNISNTKYRMGPFTVKYNEYKKGNYALSWIKSYKFYDKNNKEIKDVRLTNATGTITYNNMNDIPSDTQKGKTFYIEFNYLDNLFIDQVNIDVEVEYISKWKIDDEIKYYEVHKQKWNATNITKRSGISGTWIAAKTAAILSTLLGVPVDVPETWYSSTVKVNLTGPTTITPNPMQPLIKGDASVETSTEKIKLGVKKYGTTPDIPDIPTIKVEPQEMELAGYVWNDSATSGKAQDINGSKDTGEKSISGVLVTLYEVHKTTGARSLAKLNSERDTDTEHKYERDFYTTELGTKTTVPSTNPTITDKTGYYSFKGVDATKKYIVVFTYDGMEYEATTTKNQVTVRTDYNTDKWNKASKGSELTNDRNELNQKFVTIGSTPDNYAVSNKIFTASYLTLEGGKLYNQVFHENDLTAIREEIYNAELDAIKNKSSLNMDDGSYISNVYNKVALRHGNSTEIYRKLQYIYDCKIKSYSGYNSEEGGTSSVKQEYYPVYDKIILTNNTKDANGNRVAEKAVANAPKQTTGGYWYVYNGQLNINMGLIPRATTTLNVKEDLYKTIVSMNGKDEEYKYGTLSDKELEIAADDYLTKTLASLLSYNQVISPNDYNYNTDSARLRNGTATYEEDAAKIQVYATYKIVVKNVSNIPTTVNELVTYMDRMYLSYSDGYTTSAGKQIVGMSAFKNKTTPILEATTSANSRYGRTSETKDYLAIAAGLATGHDYQDLYINLGNSGVMLETNDSISIYITYRMGENSSKDIKYNCSFGAWHGTDNSAQTIFKNTLGKDQNNKINIETITEVNGFSTYYRIDQDSTTKQTKFAGTNAYIYVYDGKQYRAAGVMDTYSIPGNLNAMQLLETTPSEKDWDKAPTLIFSNANDTRKLSGSVWETENFANYYYDNNAPTINDNSKKIKGLTVELVELKDVEENGQKLTKQMVRATTTTDDNGNYTFTGFMPGNYVVRFVYGDKTLNSENQKDTMNRGEYQYPYNGEFYQSAKANPNTNTGDNTRFWYVNETDTRYSDAYDEANRRIEINNKFANGYKYSDAVDTIKNPTEYMMYAYTSMMEFYPEKAKLDTFGEQDPSYSIDNIDFALTPRTKTKLNITKEVAKIKLILQNGTVQFEATPEEIRTQKVPGVVQVEKGTNINISMTNELINGATLEITYKITVKNESDYDAIRYYKNNNNDVIGIGLYKEDYKSSVFYEKNYTAYNNLLNKIEVKDRDNNSMRVYNCEEFENDENGNKISKIENSGTTNIKIYDRYDDVETTTSPAMVADFVPSNLTFSQVDYTGSTINDDWEIYHQETQDEFASNYYKQKAGYETKEPTAIKDMDSSEVYNVNTIVVATGNNPLMKNLKHGEESSSKITLSKVISTENDLTDTKTYKNSVRIIKINNTVSRIQDMNNDDAHIRAKHSSETITINDPTGEDRSYTMITIILITIIIIALGIVLIKKFVLKNKI